MAGRNPPDVLSELVKLISVSQCQVTEQVKAPPVGEHPGETKEQSLWKNDRRQKFPVRDAVRAPVAARHGERSEGA